MCEVLTNAAALFEKLLDWCGDLGRLGIEAEIPMYFLHQIENRLQQRTPCGKRLARVLSELPIRPRALRAKDKLICIQTLLTMVTVQRLHDRLPGGRSGEIRP